VIQAIGARESQVVAAAKLLESDPDFAEYRVVSEWADAQALDTHSPS
jgi:quinol monooxygenase YgiN